MISTPFIIWSAFQQFFRGKEEKKRETVKAEFEFYREIMRASTIHRKNILDTTPPGAEEEAVMKLAGAPRKATRMNI